MIKLLFVCLLAFAGCTSAELKIGETEYMSANKMRTRLESNLYHVKDTVALDEYIYGDVNLKIPIFYDVLLRLSKYKDGNVLISAPYFDFDRSLFLRSILLSNGVEKVEIKIDNMSRIQGVPNVFLTMGQVEKMKKILGDYPGKNIIVRIQTEKENMDFYLTNKDVVSWLKVLEYKR